MAGGSKSERKGNSISWRSSQQAPQWAGLAWRQSAHLLQAPAALMCNHATYVCTSVCTSLVFIHCAGVNPCKSNVGASGSAAIKHFLGCCCVSAEPTGCQGSGVHGGAPAALPCFQPVFNKGNRELPTEAVCSCPHPLLWCADWSGKGSSPRWKWK